MSNISLPIYRPARNPPAQSAGGTQGAAKGETAGATEIDRTASYPSCRWLEEGIAFNRRSLNACLIVHHGRGFPHLCDYNGGPIDLGAVLSARARIIAENQAGGVTGGHAACRGCPHLVTRRWRAPRHPIGLMGIAQFSHCNIECNYCFLQTADPSVFSAGFDPYPILEPLRALARRRALSPRLTVDWGGGEPTIYKEFDAVLALLTRRGATTWVHTNGTRLPRPIREGLATRRIHVLCSVDAGTRQTWKRIKNRDLLETVWNNLAEYIRRGCRVVLKYIMKDENCAGPELRAFVARAVAIGAGELILDIDYDCPRPSEAVLTGLRELKRLATRAGLHTTFGATGSLYTPEVDVAGRLARPGRGRLECAELWLRGRLAFARAQVRLVARALRYK